MKTFLSVLDSFYQGHKTGKLFMANDEIEFIPFFGRS
jgi:hypothetical protein